MRLFDGPSKRFAQGLASDGATGLANGHQACVSPLEGTIMLQLAHQSRVRQDDEVHVPGLAHPVPELTLAHAQMLLPVPMKGLRPCPALFVDLQNAMSFPLGSVADQDLAWRRSFCF